MRCDEYQELISAEMDGELDASEKELLEEHIRECAPCRKVREDYGVNRLLLHAMAPVQAPEQAWSSLVEELKVLHPESDLSAPSRPAPVRAEVPRSRWGARLRTPRPWMSALRVAACLAVAFVGLLAWLGYTDVEQPEPMAQNPRVVVSVNPRSLIRGYAWLQADNLMADRSAWHYFVASDSDLPGAPDRRGRAGQNEYQVVQEEVR